LIPVTHVLRLGEGGGNEEQMIILVEKLNRIPLFKFSAEAKTFAKRMLVDVLFSFI
jgi:hypothetical protein